MNEPTPTEAVEFLWNASRKADMSADTHVNCQLCRGILLKVLSGGEPGEKKKGKKDPPD